MTYLKLPASLKGKYPFRIGTTSFIYPDSYARNVEILGPFLDEIELLFLQSDPLTCLPDKDEIRILAELGNELDLTYNVHLPYDVDLGHDNSGQRSRAVDILKQVIDLSAPLNPSTHTLHLPWRNAVPNPENLKQWRENLAGSLARLSHSGITGRSLSIETLSYSLDWIEDLLFEFDLQICLDIGHLMRYGFKMDPVFEKYKDLIRIIHLHGLEGTKDHRALSGLTGGQMSTVNRILSQFIGILSIEVFSFEDLVSSLKYLDPWGQNDPAY